jgi:murein peptide amidase A
MQRLNRNHGGYRGETIDIAVVLEACVATAQKYDWSVESIPAGPGVNLIALQRAFPKFSAPRSTFRVYLSTGIHGDEPAGPLALLRLLEANAWPPDVEVWALPCLNPTGFPLNRRENAAGVDLNRDYRHLQTLEIRAHATWLERQPEFDVTLCLHEDWEAHGFYIYELNPENRPSLAPKMIEAVAGICPVDRSEVIEGRPASGGIIRPNLDPGTRPQWPEAFWLLQNKTKLSYTLESPSDFPLETRVNALVAGVGAALENLRR